MAEGLNKAYLIGNLGKDAETFRHASGTRLTFTLATTEQWRDKESGDKRDRTEWHRCVLWGPRADKLAPYLVRGTKVHIEGRIETRSYQKDGQMKYSTEIRVLDLKFLGGRRDGVTSKVTSRESDTLALEDLLGGRADEGVFPAHSPV